MKVESLKLKELPTVFSGEMHHGSWRAVGGKNYLAQIFRDAGADYVVKDNEEAGENLEFEKMYAQAANADYWRILNSFPGEFSYEALKASEPRTHEDGVAELQVSVYGGVFVGGIGNKTADGIFLRGREGRILLQ